MKKHRDGWTKRDFGCWVFGTREKSAVDFINRRWYASGMYLPHGGNGPFQLKEEAMEYCERHHPEQWSTKNGVKAEW